MQASDAIDWDGPVPDTLDDFTQVDVPTTSDRLAADVAQRLQTVDLTSLADMEQCIEAFLHVVHG